MLDGYAQVQLLLGWYAAIIFPRQGLITLAASQCLEDEARGVLAAVVGLSQSVAVRANKCRGRGKWKSSGEDPASMAAMAR